MAGMMGGMHARRGSGPKEKADFHALKKIVVYGKRYLPAIIVAIILAIGGAVCSVIGPEKVKDLVNIITNGITRPEGVDMDEFLAIAYLLVGLYVGGALLSYGQQLIMANVTQYISYRLRRDISDKVNKIPLNYFDTTTIGDTLSVVTNDVDAISQTLASSVANLISSFALFLGTIVMMFRSNWILAFITIGSSIVGFIAMAFVLAKSQKYFNRKQDDLGTMNGQIEEVFTNHKIVRIFAANAFERAKFIKTNNCLYEDNWKSQILSGMNMHIMVFAGNLSYVLIFVFGIMFIIDGSTLVTLGTILSFVIYSRLFAQPLSTFAQSMTSIQQASAASKRVFALLEQTELSNEEHKQNKLKTIKGEVIFDKIRFGYVKNKEIIHGFTAHIKPGQKIAIVGPTGAGKTTIVNLLMRFYELNSGDIKIDGVSTKDLKRERVHELFNMILQDTWLFTGTVRENLVYNKKHVSDEKLDEVVKAVGLDHFIKTLPHGYDTMLDDKLNLSEGQKQQLTIARAIIKDAPLLILDEATSSVDTRTEIVIQKAMDELTKGRTSFIIAHRLSTIKNADVIFVLDQGDIVEHGNHESLLKKKGFYAELYNSQFADA
ncbi:MAG: ABC transporter ATP-binding protein/permease [Bacilli bacterium]|nr:ABC transporter ATP-binding protein/permease [Bacilli bacterium]